MTRARAHVVRRCGRRPVRAGGVAVLLALWALFTWSDAAWAQAPTADGMPGPRVMLCLYGADGRVLAGHADCPAAARPQDAMMPEAHCFYDRQGRLWRGLPRCPRMAPPFLLEEAARGR